MAKNSRKAIRKIAWKRVIPAGILLILAVYFVISLIVSLFTGGKNTDIYTICSLNGKQTLKAVGAEDRENVILVKDYNFYGENLNIYSSAYDRNSLDEISFTGDSYVLADLCSSKTYEFEISAAVDGQIDLAKLEAGFYAVYLKQGETVSRVYLDRTILNNNIIHTVTHGSIRKKIEVIANRKQFDSVDAKQSVLDQPFVYIKVTEEPVSAETAVTDYDIVISLAPSLTMDHVSLVGEQANGITEASELWNVAIELRDKLQEKGYKVMVLKDSYNAAYTAGGAFYGIGGTLDKAYGSGAKYFIFLDMGVWGGETGVWHSGFAEGAMAASIFEELQNIGLLKEGQVNPSSLDTTATGSYDEDYEIREAGGKVLGAGTYSEASQSNASFAADNIKGIETVKIVTTNITDSSSVSLWNEKKSQVADAIIRGIEKYYTGE